MAAKSKNRHYLGRVFEVKLKREVELLQYGGLLFHSAGIGFVRYFKIQ